MRPDSPESSAEHLLSQHHGGRIGLWISLAVFANCDGRDAGNGGLLPTGGWRAGYYESETRATLVRSLEHVVLWNCIALKL